ncbi:MAG: hypothetical protein KGZ86_08530 [Candidatus Latescibacteria bacterium]|nr:hypothetical protein [Candidatus Latescibacterota bacterium]
MGIVDIGSITSAKCWKASWPESPPQDLPTAPKNANCTGIPPAEAAFSVMIPVQFNFELHVRPQRKKPAFLLCDWNCIFYIALKNRIAQAKISLPHQVPNGCISVAEDGDIKAGVLANSFKEVVRVVFGVYQHGYHCIAVDTWVIRHIAVSEVIVIHRAIHIAAFGGIDQVAANAQATAYGVGLAIKIKGKFGADFADNFLDDVFAVRGDGIRAGGGHGAAPFAESIYAYGSLGGLKPISSR